MFSKDTCLLLVFEKWYRKVGSCALIHQAQRGTHEDAECGSESGHKEGGRNDDDDAISAGVGSRHKSETAQVYFFHQSQLQKRS
jgi:hypothetical protein